MTYGTDNTWAECYRDVARMRLDIEIISNDIEFVGSGESILYVVDTNTIFLYANPLEKIECARIFADDSDFLLQGLSIALGEFLFVRGLLSATDQASILLPMSLLNELLDVYDQCLYKARVESIKYKNEEKINEILKKLDDYKSRLSVDAKNDFIDYLIKYCPDLLKYLSPYDFYSYTGAIQRFGVIGQLSRLRNLDSEKRITIPDFNIIRESDEWNTWNRIFRETIKDDEERNKANKYYEHRTNVNIENDIDALALIAIINNENNNLKLLYISCDKLIHDASKKMQDSFGRNFLRQPRQYIPFIRFDGLHKSPQNIRIENIDKFKRALDDFLSLLRLSKNNYTDTLFKIINEYSIDEINKLISPFRNIPDTRRYFDELKIAREKLLSLNSLLNEYRIDTPNQMANDLAIKLLGDKDIHTILQEKQEEAFGYVTNLFTTIGIGNNCELYLKKISEYLECVNEHKGNARGPVTLRRHPTKGGDVFFENIHNYVYTPNRDKLWGTIEGSSRYIRELIIALVAADANEWNHAREYCIRALKNEQVTNNEGLYFLAITLRHTCDSSEDYLEARCKLNAFREVWQHRFGPEGVEGIECQDFRFESEKLSLDTAYFNYKEFQIGWNDDKVVDKPIFIITWNKLIEFDKSIDAIDDEKLNTIFRSRIKRQIYSNKCCLFLLDQYVNLNKKIDEAEGRQAYRELLELSKKPNFRGSYFINFLISFLAWHFDKNKVNLDEALSKTNIALRESKIPYEEPKYIFFKDTLYGAINVTN